MADYASIQERIDYGKGRAAEHLGQPFSVYRIGGAASGDFPDVWTKITENFPVFTKRLKSEREIETAIANATMFFDIIGNMNRFLLGDVFLETDPAYAPGLSYGLGATSVAGDQFNAFALAWHPPIGKTVGGRVDRRGKIYRPAESVGRNKVDGSAYWRTMHDGDRSLVLVDGQYVFTDGPDAASFVPCGLLSAYRPYGQKPFEVSGAPPGMVRPSHWFAYIPPLPGWTPREGDALITEDGARYVVVQPFFQTAGVVGSQLMMDRTSAQVT